MENEIWKDVVGYEGLYMVSSSGVVKRIDSYVKRLHYYVPVKGRILKPLDNGKGYLRVKLSKNGKDRRIMLHRIIAEAFIFNAELKKEVNHINGNKKDNNIQNLEWCTRQENIAHCYK